MFLNVKGPKSVLSELMQTFAGTQIQSNFGPEEMNIETPSIPSVEDRVVSWCEANDVEYQLI